PPSLRGRPAPRPHPPAATKPPRSRARSRAPARGGGPARPTTAMAPAAGTPSRRTRRQPTRSREHGREARSKDVVGELVDGPGAPDLAHGGGVRGIAQHRAEGRGHRRNLLGSAHDE